MEAQSQRKVRMSWGVAGVLAAIGQWVPYCLPYFLGPLPGSGGALEGWTRAFPLLPGYYVALQVGLEDLDFSAVAGSAALLQVLGFTVLLRWLGRAGDLAPWLAFLALAFCSGSVALGLAQAFYA